MVKIKKIVVYTGGVWDMFHVGHLNIFKKSKVLGNFLIVGVNTDEFVQEYKNKIPVISYKDRVKIVKACKYVDKVVKQTVLNDIRTLKKYNVNIVTIGDDWKGKYDEGLEWMKKHGKVVYIPYTKRISSTLLKEKIKKNKECSESNSCINELQEE